MTTYWYMTLDAPLRVTDEEARIIVDEALGFVSHRTNSHHFVPPFIADRIPIARDRSAHVYPAEGWIAEGGRIHGDLFLENLSREIESTTIVDGIEVTDVRSRYEPLFAALRTVVDAQVGAIVGTLASENVDCAGPLVMTDAGIRYAYSTASHPGRGTYWDAPEDYEPIDRVPPESIEVRDDGFLCDVDTAVVSAWIESRMVEASVEAKEKLLP